MPETAMESPPPEERAPLRTALPYALASAIVLGGFTAQAMLASGMPWQRALVRAILDWGPWVLLAPLVFWLTARFPLTRRKWPANVSAHLVFSVLLVLASEALVVGVFVPLLPDRYQIERPPRGEPALRKGSSFPREPGDRPPPLGARRQPPPEAERGRSYLNSAALKARFWLPLYWVLVSLRSFMLVSRSLRERERQALALQARFTQARLDALTLQLQPHFLFNTLNAIATLVHSDPDRADAMIGHLSLLLRRVLDERESGLVPLRSELELLRAYIAIEQTRFGERLRFEEDIAPDCLDARIPVMILQPIAENAVRHGLEPLGRPGTLLVRAMREEGRLRVVIEDDGIGKAAESNTKGWGVGLSNARARLDFHFGAENAQLAVLERPDGGTLVALDLPFQTTDQ
jgi:hypothetical protein